ncbi:protein translocase subunit SecDF [Flavicella sp.]|nr:protein translocase subunit SecDF [Flavicella sp.]MDA9111392.1 protein translocase subunit SecDF [Flavicella sp.]
MQNKGLIKLFAILFGLVSLYQLSFTWIAGGVENDAKEYALANAKANAEENDGRALAKFERKYLDSVANVAVFEKFGLSFSYNDIKDKEINLGLDLKGGINATLQVSVKDILIGLSNNSKNEAFIQALQEASAAQKNSTEPYLDLFFQAFEKISNGTSKLNAPDIFGNKSLREKINFQKTDEETKQALQEEISSSINTAFEVLRSRIDKFGVTQPNIQRIGNSGRILIELPGAKDIERVKKLLQSTAELQFWEVYTNQEVAQFLYAANATVTELFKEENVTAADSKDEAASEIEDLLGEVQDSTETAQTKSLFNVLYPRIPRNQNEISSIIGSASVLDTAKVNAYLSLEEVKALLPANLKHVKFLWDAKPIKDTEVINLYAIKSNRKDEAPIQGDVIINASQEYDQLGTSPEVSMTMNSRGSKLWAKMTSENVGNFVAVVLDDYVYTAPRVNTAITGGRTSISGNFSVLEAQDLANVLKAGKLPAAAHIIQSEIVGPSLGQEAIDSGIESFVLALILVLIWMVFYYGKAGLFANVALVVNILFIFGILSAFGAVLTLPGIAGIVLTIGMSVDANVLIFERIKEELAKGKALKEGISDGFNNALSSILDANITTLLTGFILFVFGTGPVKGFASTLMIGIATSLFTAIFITRILIDAYSGKGQTLTFNTGITKQWFTKINIDFLKKRKMSYAISAVILALGIGSLLTNGLNYGVDFVGGRSYVVRFDQVVNSTEVAESLKKVFESSPEVKTYGSSNQLKITTKYKIDEEGQQVDEQVQTALFEGVKAFLPEGTTLDQFNGGFDGQKIGVFNAIKVEPTIADDIKSAAQWAIIGSLLIVFLYILMRFKKWQYSLGAVIAVFHDVLIVLSIFSIAYKVMPFDMEIGQSFIAAILTVVGYSLNDTVVIFDRIREFTKLHEKWKYSDVVNSALSSTLGRTINTSLTTLIVLLAIFIFGGDSIRGFMFALIVGVLVGTYSSLFIASPIMYDTSEKLKEIK